MPPNVTHFVEVAIPAGVQVKVLGEFADGRSGGKLQVVSNSETSLAAAKAAVDTLGNNVKAGAV